MTVLRFPSSTYPPDSGGERVVAGDAPSGDRRANELRRREPLDLDRDDLGRLIQSLEEEMHEAAADLRFEYAARLRDEVGELKRELKEISEAAR